MFAECSGKNAGVKNIRRISEHHHLSVTNKKNVFATLSLRRRTSPTFSLALQGDEEDPAEEAAEEGLGIGMPATRLNQRGQHSRYQMQG